MYREFYYYDRGYKVTEYGEVYRLAFEQEVTSINQFGSYNCIRHHKEILMKSYIDDDGYRNIGLNASKNISRIFRLHHIVYLVWVLNKDHIDNSGIGYDFDSKNFIQINHKDGNKLNNYYKNLELVTLQENIQHAVEQGLHNSQLKSWYIDIYHKGEFITTLWKLRNVRAWIFNKTGRSVDETVISAAIKSGKSLYCLPGYTFKINPRTDLSLTKTKRHDD